MTKEQSMTTLEHEKIIYDPNFWKNAWIKEHAKIAELKQEHNEIIRKLKARCRRRIKRERKDTKFWLEEWSSQENETRRLKEQLKVQTA